MLVTSTIAPNDASGRSMSENYAQRLNIVESATKKLSTVITATATATSYVTPERMFVVTGIMANGS
jgi:hypothetical protein